MDPLPLLRMIFFMAALLLAAASGFAYFAGLGWPLEVLSHFHMHFLVLSLVIAGLLALCHARRAVLFAVFAAALNLPILAPYLGISAPHAMDRATAVTEHMRPVTFATVNLLAEPAALDAFRRYVNTTKPDAFLITEIPWDRWKDYGSSFPEYHWRLPTGLVVKDARAASVKFEPGKPPDGVSWLGSQAENTTVSLPPHRSDWHRFKRSLRHVALFSKHPIANARVLWAQPPATPVLVVNMTLAPCTQPLTVVGLHAFAPMTRRDMAHRDRAIRLAAGVAGHTPGPAVLLGDLNATPWSPIIREVTKRNRLRDSSRGRLAAATWSRRVIPAALARLPFVGLPIDHAFVSPAITVDARRTGPYLGSDHRPLLVRLSVPLIEKDCRSLTE